MANACMLQNYRVATLAQIFLCRIFLGCWRKILRQLGQPGGPYPRNTLSLKKVMNKYVNDTES